MNKEQLNKLQTSRIMNMSRIYENIGDSSAKICTKLGRPHSQFRKDKLSDIEAEVVNAIAEVVHIAGIDLIKLISRLLSEIEYHYDQKKIIDNLSTMEVLPIGYIQGKEYVEAIYLEDDQFRPRSSDHNSKSRFMTLSDVFALKEKVSLTDRGKNLLMEV